MIININILKNKLIILSIFYFCLSFNVLQAKIYDEIKITGNQRLSVETIIMFSQLKTGVNLDKEQLNDSIKNLYKTNYFSNIELETINDTILIKVIENPIIQTININGIKNNEILEQLYDLTKKDKLSKEEGETVYKKINNSFGDSLNFSIKDNASIERLVKKISGLLSN